MKNQNFDVIKKEVSSLNESFSSLHLEKAKVITEKLMEEDKFMREEYYRAVVELRNALNSYKQQYEKLI